MAIDPIDDVRFPGFSFEPMRALSHRGQQVKIGEWLLLSTEYPMCVPLYHTSLSPSLIPSSLSSQRNHAVQRRVHFRYPSKIAFACSVLFC